MESKQLFNEINKHLINDSIPSLYLNKLRDNELFLNQYPFTIISKLINTEQSKIHHPEGSVWNHTLLVVDNCAKRKEESNDKKVLLWSAFLHDVGKAETTRINKGRITSYNHDRVGAELAMRFLNEFIKDEPFIKKVSNMVKWHMQLLYVSKNLPFANLKNMINEVPINEIALLCLCDRLGRGGTVDEKKEKEDILFFLEKCNELV